MIERGGEYRCEKEGRQRHAYYLSFRGMRKARFARAQLPPPLIFDKDLGPIKGYLKIILQEGQKIIPLQVDDLEISQENYPPSAGIEALPQRGIVGYLDIGIVRLCDVAPEGVYRAVQKGYVPGQPAKDKVHIKVLVLADKIGIGVLLRE